MPAKRTLPAKGTKRREIVRMLFRTRGVTPYETPYDHPSSFGRTVEALRDDFGLDIRQFNDKEPNPSGVGRRHHVYKVVGWDRPNGRYRSFVTLDTAVRPVNTDND